MKALLTVRGIGTAAMSVLFVGLLSQCHTTQRHTTLRIWQTETDKDAVGVLGQMKKQFEQKYPEVSVEIEAVGWSSLSNKLAVAINTNNAPDLAHLEPFMAASLVNRGLLIPLDDVLAEVERKNGPIFASVRELQQFGGVHYGIAYAVGTTGFAYRKDVAEQYGLKPGTTWKEYLKFAEGMRKVTGDKLKVLLPGGDPFFIDQLFAELVANNGGRLFDASTSPQRPLLTSRNVIETFEFFRDLAPSVDAGWLTQLYLDQFNRLARGEAGNVPVTYARAFQAINAAAANGTLPAGVKASPDFFAWMRQPIGPSYHGLPIATIDCEPYVIFKSAEQRNGGAVSNAEYARRFLKDFFYEKDAYLKFVNTVPIHLTPIFERFERDVAYQQNPALQQWKAWATQTQEFINAAERTRPILMPDATEQGRALPFLMDFQSNRIISDAITRIVANHEQVSVVAAEAQRKAEDLIRQKR